MICFLIYDPHYLILICFYIVSWLQGIPDTCVCLVFTSLCFEYFEVYTVKEAENVTFYHKMSYFDTSFGGMKERGNMKHKKV